jgi:hypothetical protein
LEAIAAAHRLHLVDVGVLVAPSDGSREISVDVGAAKPAYAEMTGAD